eukprot:g6543.t1
MVCSCQRVLTGRLSLSLPSNCTSPGRCPSELELKPRPIGLMVPRLELELGGTDLPCNASQERSEASICLLSAPQRCKAISPIRKIHFQRQSPRSLRVVNANSCNSCWVKLDGQTQSRLAQLLSSQPPQDSQESLSGDVHSRWDPTKVERRYAYGSDATVKFSGVRRIEWNQLEWKDRLLFKGIASPPAEWQVEVERQKAGRLAEDFRRLKERVDRAKKASKTGRKDARANARVERQARIEKKLMQQNTQAQLLVENMEEALLKVPELRPPVAPELHPNELLQAKLVIHDLATSGLGEKSSSVAETLTAQNSIHSKPRAVMSRLVLFEDAIESARATMAIPITGGSLLLLALVSLNYFHRTFSREKNDQVVLGQGRTSPGLETSSTMTPPLSDNLETGFEDRLEDASTVQGSTQHEDYVSVSSGDEGSPQIKVKEEVHAPFLALFRFASRWDMFCTLMATILGAIHGSTMPMAFFFLSDLYHAVYMPNDDGSLPPVNAPHTIRDSKVTEVGMTYILLALVVLCARTGGCYLAIHSADRQVVRARRQYFQQILMQGPSWHDLHHANELAPQLVQDTHLFRDGIGERLVDFSRAVAMAMSASVT